MSEVRRKRRRDWALRGSLDIQLQTLLDNMCRFLDQVPKPSDMAVQFEFIRIRDRWHDFCDSRGCSDWEKNRFNREFRVIWEKRYRTPQSLKSKESVGTRQLPN